MSSLQLARLGRRSDARRDAVLCRAIDPGRARGDVAARHAHQGRGVERGGVGGNLFYHGGPVMRTNTTYAIYWVPPGYFVSSGYVSIIDQYFANVAADSG